MGNGRLDLLMALGGLPAGNASPDFIVSAGPSSATIVAGSPANFTVAAAPANKFSGTVTWNCAGAPPAALCPVSPATGTLCGPNPPGVAVTLTHTAHPFLPPPL